MTFPQARTWTVASFGRISTAPYRGVHTNTPQSPQELHSIVHRHGLTRVVICSYGPGRSPRACGPCVTSGKGYERSAGGPRGVRGPVEARRRLPYAPPSRPGTRAGALPGP